MAKRHEYQASIVWTGNRGTGTSDYRAYDRNWDIAIEGKPVIHCSNDPLLGGNPALHNPEDLLISALSACHMLWYLHLCSSAGVTVTSYSDNALGFGEVERNGAGRFLAARLRPRVTIAKGCDPKKANDLHGEVHKYCFIARSVNFPVEYAPQISISE
jgi:organic hydroperoxide reductase OsmC/OhrA